jgi:hypothetical protein
MIVFIVEVSGYFDTMSIVSNFLKKQVEECFSPINFIVILVYSL